MIDPGFVRTGLGRRATGAVRVLLTVTRAVQVRPERPAALIRRRLQAEDFTDGAYCDENGPSRPAANARDAEAIARAWRWTHDQLL